MEKVRPWCGQLSDRGRLKNRTTFSSESACLFINITPYSSVKSARSHSSPVLVFTFLTLYICIPPGSLNRVPASAGVRAGMSPLPLCDPMWHVSSRRSVSTLRTAVHCYLLTRFPPAPATDAAAAAASVVSPSLVTATARAYARHSSESDVDTPPKVEAPAAPLFEASPKGFF